MLACLILDIFVQTKYICLSSYTEITPDSKVRGAIMGPIWGGQGPGGPHAGPMNFAIWNLIL